MDVKQLRDVAEKLFADKQPLVTLWQEQANNFYPERADFTLTRSWGTDFAADLMSSYPVRCRRDLGNQFGTMLRPTARPWFHVKRRNVDMDGEDTEVKQWLEYFEQVERRAMYDRATQFTRATKEGDHDFAAFGQCAISIEMNGKANGLLYRCWHLRDMAWQEDEEGQIGTVFRKWKPTVQTLVRSFKKVHPKVTEMNDKTPFETIEVLHMVVGADMYDGNSGGKPRWSIYYDTAHDFIMEEKPIWERHYVIPRWQTVSGSQYSYSPATVCALPDARLLQAMTFTLLEAGEKATSPPIIATQGAVRSDMALFAGGVTWVDNEYDERLGEAMRPLQQDFRGFNYGVAMNQDTRAMLHAAFFLDALTLPQRAPEMTAYEVGQRVQEYIRNALPIFEPMEQSYNEAICDETFGLLLRGNAFGDPRSFPKKLRGADIDFTFESPLHDAIDQQKGQLFQQAQAIIGGAVALDPSCSFVPKAEVALRDALTGIGVPARWMNTEGFVEQAKEAKANQDAQQQRLAQITQAAGAAKDIGQSGLVPQQQAGVAQRTMATAV